MDFKKNHNAHKEVDEMLAAENRKIYMNTKHLALMITICKNNITSRKNTLDISAHGLKNKHIAISNALTKEDILCDTADLAFDEFSPIECVLVDRENITNKYC